MKLPIAIELDELSEEDLLRVAGGEERLINRHGQPFALLLPISEETLDEQLRALRLHDLGRLVAEMRVEASASGAGALSEQDIQAEIDAVRRQRQPAQ